MRSCQVGTSKRSILKLLIHVLECHPCTIVSYVIITEYGTAAAGKQPHEKKEIN